MPVTTFSGTVEDGQVKLEANVHLPEKTKVFVVVPDFDEKANGKKFDLTELVSRMPANIKGLKKALARRLGREDGKFLANVPKRATSIRFSSNPKPVMA